jgi:hypothetical protein
LPFRNKLIFDSNKSPVGIETLVIPLAVAVNGIVLFILDIDCSLALSVISK